MTITLVRVCLLSLAVAFSLSAFACVGPQGPPGPPGPPASSEGPPYVWICAPANNLFAENGNSGSLYVFNASSATANIAAHLLDEKGANLAGVAIPGTNSGLTYPGQQGNATHALLPAHTFTIRWLLPRFPQDSGLPFGDLPVTNLLANRSTAIRVTSDQPIAVSAEYQLTDANTIPCSRVTK